MRRGASNSRKQGWIAGRTTVWEDRLGRDAVIAHAWAVRLFGTAAALATGICIWFLISGIYHLSGAYTAIGWFLLVLATGMGLTSALLMSRATRLILAQNGLPPEFASSLSPRLLNDTEAFDKWLAESRLTILNRRTTQADDPSV